jgi:hypothetical protein
MRRRRRWLHHGDRVDSDCHRKHAHDVDHVDHLDVDGGGTGDA